MSEAGVMSRLDEHGVLTVTLNRPEVKNALDTASQRRLGEILEEAARTPPVRVVVLTGAGRAFCSGGDVRSLGAPDPDDRLAREFSADPTWSEAEARADRLRALSAAAVSLYRLGKPTIAMIRGPAAGMGLSLALACDFRCASPDAFFVTAFAKIGTSGDYGGSYFMTQLIGPARTKELYMLSERVGAERALELGLISRLFGEEALERETGELARRLAEGPPVALRYIKENVHAALEAPFAQAFESELRNMIRTRLTQDAGEGSRAFAEKRAPRFRGL